MTQGLTVLGDECTEAQELSSGSPGADAHSHIGSGPTKGYAKMGEELASVRAWAQDTQTRSYYRVNRRVDRSI